MLAEKPWRFEPVARLVAALMICQFLGATILAAVRFFSRAPEANPWLVGALVAGSLVSCSVGLFIIRKPWEFERFSRQFLLLILFVYLGLTLGAFVQHLAGKAEGQNLALRVAMSALCFQGALLLMLPRFLREHGEAWGNAFGLHSRPGMAVLIGGLVACVFLPFGELLQRGSLEIISRFGVQPESQAAVEALRTSNAWLDRAALAVVAVILAPIAEEILFRGVLYPAIRRGGFPRLAFWGTSLLFALIHVNLVTLLPLLLFSLLLTLLYERTGNLLAPMTAHAVFNLLNFLKFLWLEWRFAAVG